VLDEGGDVLAYRATGQPGRLLADDRLDPFPTQGRVPLGEAIDDVPDGCLLDGIVHSCSVRRAASVANPDEVNGS